MEFLTKISTWAKQLTEVGISVIALGVVLEVLFKGAVIPFWPDVSVVDNIMGILGGLSNEVASIMQPIVSKIANFEEKKLLSSCSKSLEIYSEITKSKLLEFKNYLSNGPIYLAAGLIKMSCSRCSK